jgi:Na+/phosphate symporter
MKAIIILAILLTIAIVLFRFKKDKNVKKLLITMASFGFIISMAVVGNITRPIIPLYMAHMILIVIAWMSMFMYVFKNKYCWWWVLAPLFTIGLFFGLEFLGGSAHELG